MNDTFFMIDGIPVPVLSFEAAVIGSGCAGFNGADWLYDLGRKNIALITEGINMGTSRNTGSDKQTYYKLTLASDGKDSIRQMAEDLFAPGRVNGDTALAEAANSVRSFIKLANLGVPFPANEYGEYVGYRTDHDLRQRATSAGPLTSKYMTECLEKSVMQKGIRILDGFMVFKLLVWEGHLEGFLCLNKKKLNTPSMGITLIRTRHAILAAGGPAGCYFDSVYPVSQTGMSGMALEAGAIGANLDQWQYGLSSTKFRWNVSGSYQQVLPKYISIDSYGNEREFLPEYFDDPYKALNMVFLKGYQWPFHTANLAASSKIDLIIHYEIKHLGRRVYLDYRNDPSCLANGFEKLGPEVRHYLSSSNALIRTPLKRLEIMNTPAIKLYRSHGIDLYKEPLEIALCAQHHNGGLDVDSNWETSIKGLYAAGEAAGTFGLQRPGGSALNSTQVGSMRGAQHIAYTTPPGILLTEEFKTRAIPETAGFLQLFHTLTENTEISRNSFLNKKEEMQKKMSRSAAHLRDRKELKKLQNELAKELENFFEKNPILSIKYLPELLKTRDIFITQLAVLSAMEKAAKEEGAAGCALILKDGGEELEKLLKYTENPCRSRALVNCNQVLLTGKSGKDYTSEFKPVRPIPCPENWFEKVWKEYRDRTGQL